MRPERCRFPSAARNSFTQSHQIYVSEKERMINWRFEAEMPVNYVLNERFGANLFAAAGLNWAGNKLNLK